MNTICGIIVYGIVALFLIVGLGATLLQYGLKIAAVALIVYFIYSVFSKK